MLTRPAAREYHWMLSTRLLAQVSLNSRSLTLPTADDLTPHFPQSLRTRARGDCLAGTCPGAEGPEDRPAALRMGNQEHRRYRPHAWNAAFPRAISSGSERHPVGGQHERASRRHAAQTG